jgi:glyoxylase-like metal-dependent hydrolase (beta-lactamase superfamily II)
MGFYDRVALSRFIRWTAFSDREAARRSLEQVLSLSFDRLVVGHGAPVTRGARESLAAAYNWLLK